MVCESVLLVKASRLRPTFRDDFMLFTRGGSPSSPHIPRALVAVSVRDGIRTVGVLPSFLLFRRAAARTKKAEPTTAARGVVPPPPLSAWGETDPPGGKRSPAPPPPSPGDASSRCPVPIKKRLVRRRRRPKPEAPHGSRRPAALSRLPPVLSLVACGVRRSRGSCRESLSSQFARRFVEMLHHSREMVGMMLVLALCLIVQPR